MATVVDMVLEWKRTLLALGPAVAVVLIVLGAIVYGLAQLQPAEKRGKWQSLAVSMAIGGVIVAAVTAAAETVIVPASESLLK
jgi:hypothetical protein